MRLTKDEFVTHVSYLLKMSDETDQIENALGTTETILSQWFDHYYRLIDTLCEFDESDYENLDGTPLDYWLFKADEEYCIFPYYHLDKDEVIFNTTEDVYDFIVKNSHSEVQGS